MKKNNTYKALCQEEKNFLQDTAQKVAILVDKSHKKIDYFRKQLTTFADKWISYETAKEAERKGKWQPSMGMPSNPLLSIWPGSVKPNCLPNFGDIPIVLGGYALLAIIHDNVLPNCPSIANDILPKELVNKIWRDLITGANEEHCMNSRWVIPTSKIENFLHDVKTDIENHFSPQERASQKLTNSSDKNGSKTKPQVIGGIINHKTEQDSKEKKEESLEPKPPVILQNLKWLLLHGTKHWQLILLAIIVLIVASIFALPKLDLFSLIFKLIKSIHF